MPDSLLEPYVPDPNGQQARLRNTRAGMSPTLIAAFDVPADQLTAEQADLVCRAAHRYRAALRDIKDAAERADTEAIVRVATAALAQLSADEPRDDDNEHVSVRMCQWIAEDRFRDLAIIVDAHAAGDDVAEVAARRVARAFAPVGLR